MRGSVFELVERRPNQLMVFLLSSFTVPIMVGLLSNIVFVPSAALFGVPASPGLLGAPALRSLRPARIADVVITVITLLGLGFGAGCLVARRLSSAISSFLWIWLIPVALFANGFIHPWRHPFVHDRAVTIFFQGTAGADEGLQFVFGTIPAFSSTGYSLGILFSRSVQRKLQDSNQGSDAGSAPQT